MGEAARWVRSVLSREGIKNIFGVSLYRNAIYLIIGSLLNSLFGFVFWIVAARFYTTEEVGLGSAAISAVLLLSNFANLGLGYGMIRFLPKSANPARMINTMLTTSILASVVAAATFLAGLGVWSPALAFIRDNPVYLILFIVFTGVFTAASLLDNAFIATRHSGFTVTKNLIFSVLKIIAAVPLAAGMAAFGILTSWGIATAITALICLIWLLPRVLTTPNPAFPLGKGEGARRYRLRPAMDTGVLRETARFSMGNWVGALLWTAPSQVLTLMVVHQLGAEANAHFYVAYTIATILFTIPTMASTSLLAEGSHDERSMRRHVQHSLKLSFTILVPAVAVVVLVAKYLLLPFGSGYGEGANLLRLMAVSALPLAVNVIYLGVKRVEMRVGTVIIISGLTAVLTLGLSWLLVPRMGINGAGLAWLVGQAAVGIGIIIKQILDQRRQ
jgi:O-antigen/teichoic acid export membrane protein